MNAGEETEQLRCSAFGGLHLNIGMLESARVMGLSNLNEIEVEQFLTEDDEDELED